MYPFRFGLGSEALDIAQPSGLDENAKMLTWNWREGGYTTHVVGKWHLGWCKKAYRPLSRGFDSFFGVLGGQNDYLKHTVTPDRVLDYFDGEKIVHSTENVQKDFTDRTIQIARVIIIIN